MSDFCDLGVQFNFIVAVRSRRGQRFTNTSPMGKKISTTIYSHLLCLAEKTWNYWDYWNELGRIGIIGIIGIAGKKRGRQVEKSGNVRFPPEAHKTNRLPAGRHSTPAATAGLSCSLPPHSACSLSVRAQTFRHPNTARPDEAAQSNAHRLWSLSFLQLPGVDAAS